ncbi:hypothetical protein JCM10908_005717 [Rhodotorula pacifica]|uniref:zinc finger MYND domain-containing protein n=1 Tax=Rhodotorula pacifica TaxID=1495444 RepID=UPI00317FC4C4
MATTTSATSVPECALCQVPATAKCGRCKNIWFCSELCQKTLWPVHKHLCGGDPKYFRQAPLTDRELKDFDRVKESSSCAADCECAHGKSFREMMSSYPGIGSWENACKILKSSPKILVKPDPRTDYREMCLIDVRRKLRDVYKVTDPSSVSSPWIELEWFYTAANWALIKHRQPEFSRVEEMQLTAVASQALNDWLRQALIYCQIADLGIADSSLSFDLSPHTWIRLFCTNWDRLVALLDKANINTEAKKAIREQMSEKQMGIEVMRSMRGAFWIGPARHPSSEGAVTSFGLG